MCIRDRYLISPEVLSFVFILTIAALVCIAIRNRAHVPEMVKRASGATGVALSVTAVLLAYPLWMSFYGPVSYTHLRKSGGTRDHADQTRDKWNAGENAKRDLKQSTIAGSALCAHVFMIPYTSCRWTCVSTPTQGW